MCSDEAAVRRLFDSFPIGAGTGALLVKLPEFKVVVVVQRC